MKDWREHPHLFDNGKFKVKWESDNIAEILDIEGYVFKEPIDLFRVRDFNNERNGAQYEYAFVKDCTLIARPIEDMTDEECREVAGFPDMPIKKLREYLEAGKIADVRIPMLSIGVYPFDQSHFGDSVIDIRTLNE